jgi:hypothetical protein
MNSSGVGGGGGGGGLRVAIMSLASRCVGFGMNGDGSRRNRLHHDPVPIPISSPELQQ